MTRIINKFVLKNLIVDKTKKSLTDKLSRVLDFIQFLKLKRYKKSGRKSFNSELMKELSDLNENSLSHLEEEFFNYKEYYAREW